MAAPKRCRPECATSTQVHATAHIRVTQGAEAEKAKGRSALRFALPEVIFGSVNS
jgi:hypothetical protein